MSNTPTTNNHQEEIDLGYIFNKFNQLFKKAVRLFFEILALFIKYKLFTFTLLLLLIAYGFYIDKNSKRVFENKIIVIPNFESVDYLYEQVQSLNQKHQVGDTVVLKSIFSDNFKNFKGLKVEPYVDIYDFVSASRENVDIFKVFAQNHDLAEYINDVTNSKYYKYHLIKFRSSGKQSSEEMKDSLISYFNKNQHFSEYREIFKVNTAFSIQENEDMINQIDSIIAASFKLKFNDVPNQSFFMNDNSNLNGLIHTKKMLVEDRLNLSLRQNDEVSTVKEVSSSFNLMEEGKIVIPNKIKYPLYFILLFFGLFIVIKTGNKLKNIAKQ